MDRPDNGLGTSGELQDLLEYLADRLTYSPLGYMQDERGKLIVPMITARARWHCSRQSDTMLAEKLQATTWNGGRNDSLKRPGIDKGPIEKARNRQKSHWKGQESTKVPGVRLESITHCFQSSIAS